MRYRLFGPTGLRVSELFLGAMAFTTDPGGGAGPVEARAMVDRYAERGGNTIDTASAYSDSEEILGKVLQGRRDSFVVASKYTLSRDGADPNASGNQRKNLRLTLEQSLRRLRTDHVDIYWVHTWDRHTPLEETLRALDDAVSAGKILYAGLSDAPAWVAARANTLAEWRGWTPFAGLQVPYNPLVRDIERDVLPMAEDLGLSVAAWRGLARGVLAGRPTDDPVERAVASAVAEAAEEAGATPAQAALAWQQAKSPAVHPLIGASSLTQLDEALGAADTSLSAEAVARIDAASGFDPGFFARFSGNGAGPLSPAQERLDRGR
ncbi:aldo/keto reductase [Nocardiopsis coralliicola]